MPSISPPGWGEQAGVQTLEGKPLFQVVTEATSVCRASGTATRQALPGVSMALGQGQG